MVSDFENEILSRIKSLLKIEILNAAG